MIDALKLLRIPFSVFLMPVFWFSLVSLEYFSVSKAILIFIILHVFVYPASNGYNSYFDRDEESIGGLEKPPKVNRYLFPLVILFDLVSVVLSYFVSLDFTLCVIIYILVSKAYSWDKIRLKKYPFASTVVVTVFQGAFIYLAVQFGLLNYLIPITTVENLLLAVSSTLFLAGSYPLTQIYQHSEDNRRGDKTLSLLLGIKGTFYFSSLFFLFGTVLLIYSFIRLDELQNVMIFLAVGAPILLYFGYWFKLCLKDEKFADFKNAMRMNAISSLSLSLAFVLMLLIN